MNEIVNETNFWPHGKEEVETLTLCESRIGQKKSHQLKKQNLPYFAKKLLNQVMS